MGMFSFLTRWLQHPLTAGMHVDDPETTLRRRSIIRCKAFLSRLYREWYDTIGDNIPGGEGDIVELGAGAGFMKDHVPGLITADVLAVAGIDVVLPSSGGLPFGDGALRAIVMTDVLHHISHPRSFFREAARTVRPGGGMVMIEPWVTPWACWVYRHLHTEPFLPDARAWEFPTQGPLSGANGALPWILFERDRLLFEHDFPEWRVASIQPLMPFAYLLSGGVSMRALAPGWMYGPCRAVERAMGPLGQHMAMFAMVRLNRINGGTGA